MRRARELNPGINFHQGDMPSLKLPDARFAGITAFYSLIHIPPAKIVAVLRELHRVLRPGSALLAAFHIGDTTVHLDEWWGHEVSVDFHFFQPEQTRTWLETAGFEIEESPVRNGPMAGISTAQGTVRATFALVRNIGLTAAVGPVLHSAASHPMPAMCLPNRLTTLFAASGGVFGPETACPAGSGSHPDAAGSVLRRRVAIPGRAPAFIRHRSPRRSDERFPEIRMRREGAIERCTADRPVRRPELKRGLRGEFGNERKIVHTLGGGEAVREREKRQDRHANILGFLI